MRKFFLSHRFQTLSLALVIAFTASTIAFGSDRFALAVGAQGKLVIFGPKGDRVAELAIPSISAPVTVGDVSFQVSYGRDANDLVTAIIAPSASSPQDLHFNVLNKSVDANKLAVVTLTFTQGFKSVAVDPGYIGLVQVNAHSIKHHELADDTYVPPHHTAPAAPAPHMVAKLEPVPAPVHHEAATAPETSIVSTAPAAGEPVENKLPPVEDVAASSEAPSSLVPPPIISGTPYSEGIPRPLPTASATASGEPTLKKEKLYWSEPVTPPSGSPPSVGISEMKLVQVDGPVLVTLANGETKSGENGMILPSGSSVVTSDTATAAIFMGGVNSARLMPDCHLKVTQNLNGSVRKTTIDLEHGAVFSRIGRRSGETQDYQVRTPEGVAAARGTEFMTFRGDISDIKDMRPSVTSNASWIGGRLLAWSPTLLGHGLISDVTLPLFAAATAPPSRIFNKGGQQVYGSPHFYIFVAKGTVNVSVNGQVYQVLSGNTSNLGAAVVPPYGNAETVLQVILEILQPHNHNLNSLLSLINSGTANSSEKAFYDHLILVFFGGQPGDFGIQDLLEPDPLRNLIPAERRALNQDLKPFGTNPLTPF